MVRRWLFIGYFLILYYPATRAGRPTGNSVQMTVMGLGALVAWSNLVRYFEFSPRFYVLVLTLERSMPDILRFVVSCIPVLVGYALECTRRRTAMEKLRIVRLGFGTARQKKVLE
jgi:hypothetical protein